MDGYLRQATASQNRTLGPFHDDTDFKTPETALTIANTDIKLIANGSGIAVDKNSGGANHVVNGMYNTTFNATDTATVGELKVSIVVAGALPVWHTYIVLEPEVYDRDFKDAATGVVESRTPSAGALATMLSMINVVLGSMIQDEGGGFYAFTEGAGAHFVAHLGTGEPATIADAILARNIAGGSDGGRTVKEALYILRNKSERVAGVLTVYLIDDLTPSWTAVITTAAGDPITVIDPA